jgi:hypothetical protein
MSECNIPLVTNRAVLFLDLDGVLNDHAFNEESASCTLKPECVRQFNRILGACRPDVVLSSAWRYLILQRAMNLAGFAAMLRTHGVAREISVLLTGYTPPDEAVPSRGKQIEAYLHTVNGPVAVLDDAPVGMCFKPVEHLLVRTEGSRGLTAAEADRVIAMLKGKDVMR